MDLLVNVVVVLHLLGMAAIIGSAVFVARGAVTPALPSRWRTTTTFTRRSMATP